MHLSRRIGSRIVPALIISMLVAAAAVQAAPIAYTVNLDGPSESPPNASPGTGFATIVVDPVAHTLQISVTFSGLIGATTASHIHAATAVAFTGTAGVATTTPYFAGFPIGVTSGTYNNTLDMTLASSYNPAYVTAHGGTTSQSETDLFAAIAAGKAYLNIHSQFATGGEIRGFLVPQTVPTQPSTWGSIKALYR
jgi:hypothetical protein